MKGKQIYHQYINIDLLVGLLNAFSVCVWREYLVEGEGVIFFIKYA